MSDKIELIRLCVAFYEGIFRSLANQIHGHSHVMLEYILDVMLL